MSAATTRSRTDAGVTEAPARTPRRVGPRALASGGVGLVLLVAVLVLVGAWHLTQGTSGVGLGDLLGAALGHEDPRAEVPVSAILSASRLPRLLAGVAVGFALGVAGAVLQSLARNALASPDTLAVTSGSYLALVLVAAFELSVPLWASGAVAFAGGLAAAALVLTIAGGSGTSTTRLVLAGSAVALALQAATSALLILFQVQTTGLFAWGSGSLAQLNLDASLRAMPVIAVLLALALVLARRLDVLGLGDDAAASLGISVRRTRMIGVLIAVLLTAIAVTVAGPVGFVGLGAPVLARLLASLLPGLHRHLLLLPASGLLGAITVITADALLRALMGAQDAAKIPTGIATSMVGAVIMVVLARRLRDSGPAEQPPQTRTPPRSSRRALAVGSGALLALIGAALLGLLAGSLWLRTGDLVLWATGSAPAPIRFALDERLPRVLAAIVGGAALALAGTVVQSTVRNPLAEPGILGITAGAGLGAVTALTLGGAAGASRPVMISAAVAAGLVTFAVIYLLSWRRGIRPERLVLVGIGMGFGLSSLTALLLLASNPWDTPRLLTWLSGTTYGRALPDVAVVGVVLVLAVPLVLGLSRELDLLALDEDSPRIVGVRLERVRLAVIVLAAVVASISVVAVGTVGFVGLVAPHLARGLVGSRHARTVPLAMLLGGLLVSVADTLGRTLIAPAQMPAGLVVAVIGAPYFVWLLWRSRA
ncbi:ABC transporter permease [Brachybacterium endophyticum]|uniref:ABC transporter permease n=1 Tax=Brachybacterium endophyticum TaxID=2182385 RepID=A0A2U2RNY0_9MICO|nr:iron ABC transporter permease [Brachybacterium endophyticum]PWH07541.1 ABC transporter permease [Brachybacterium endophyticum]